MKHTARTFGCVAAASIAFAVAGAVQAAEIKLPKTITWTAYNVGTAGYNQSVAIGSALKNRLGVSLRVVPGKNDIARQLPVRDGKIQFSATGLGAYYSQEGLFAFAERKWGPQDVRLLAVNLSKGHGAVLTAKDANIRTVADFKGKRITWVRGAPSLNGMVSAILAFAGLSWNDVTKVEVPGFVPAMKAVMNGQADAATAISTSGFTNRIAASPRGLYWPQLPHDDAAGWARVNKLAPWLQKNANPIGAGIPKGEKFDGVTLPYPWIIAYPSQSRDLVYNMTKAIHELYDDYKDGAPGVAGFALDRQIFKFVAPYHEAAIKYYKERGVWTADMQAHNKKLVGKQNLLSATWKKQMAAGIKDRKTFEAAWMKARAAVLDAAGFDPIWR